MKKFPIIGDTPPPSFLVHLKGGLNSKPSNTAYRLACSLHEPTRSLEEANCSILVEFEAWKLGLKLRWRSKPKYEGCFDNILIPWSVLCSCELQKKIHAPWRLQCFLLSLYNLRSFRLSKCWKWKGYVCETDYSIVLSLLKFVIDYIMKQFLEIDWVWYYHNGKLSRRQHLKYFSLNLYNNSFH